MDSDEKSQQAIYDLLLQDRHTGRELTQRDKELLELEVRINHHIDKRLLENPTRIPKAIYFIIPNEFGERFCMTGIKILLALYFPRISGISNEHTKTLVHAFTMISYFFPIVGAALSDSFLGKYRTISSLSIVYWIGTLLLAIFSINGVLGQYGSIPIAGPYVALMLMAIGTGGIKPCVSTHGGDQYLPHQKDGIDWFYTMFYTSINIGGLLSQNITPHLVNKVTCFGERCYFAAFFLPSVVFGIVTFVFIFGARYYRVVPPVGEFLPYKALKAAIIAGKRWLAASSEERKRKHGFLDFAEDVVGAPFVEETRQLGRIIYMILPTIFFWMIYDQNTTEWQYQYQMMNNRMGSYDVSPESFQVINSLLIIVMVPALGLLYPRLERLLKIRFTTLRRISAGFFLVCLSFIISGCLQLGVEARYNPVLAADGKTVLSCEECVHCLWQVPQWFILSLAEALASPTGLLFCYEESGSALRAQSSSMWLLMISLGNVVIVALSASVEENGKIVGPSKYFFYAGIGLAAWLWFSIQAYFYKYKADSDAERIEENRHNLEDKSKE
ncbi:uncharacterized protein VTP21DRAFT_11383 [Calcarisporiella thermophila]|uniref:uncharacterized protein n=1 Tax=Calcarisporiella thermophila TaxID=911321 RepID=UPI003743BC7D